MHFQRDLTVRILEESENVLRLEAQMTDSHHDLTLQVDVEVPGNLIVKAEVITNRVPSERCCPIREVAHRLVGLRIEGGFSERVLRAIGGSEGCVNLTSMILFAAPIFVNMSVNYTFAKQGVSSEELPRLANEMMRGKCLAY